MTREITSKNRIALLATGDEIIQGDILNTNAQEIAQKLFSHGMQVGMQMTVGDHPIEIKTAIRFLLQTHRALIITGGLGPTTDDLTRYALAEALNRELIFDEATWNWIIDRFNTLGYSTPPENNRQQALFPEEAVIIPNNNGSAAGCILKEDEHLIFMLPGPPLECMPMIDKVVLPALEIANFPEVLYHAKWLLFGVSEGHIAEQLEETIKHHDCTTGYRVCYPYVEIKLHSTNETDFHKLVPLVEKEFSAYMIEDGKQTASDLLKRKLLTLNHPLTILDLATGGSLEATIRTPETNDKLHFVSGLHTESPSKLTVSITGLNDFWQHKQATHTLLEMTFTDHTNVKPEKFTIPCRGSRVKLYAVEFICQRIYHYLEC
jgi:molybdenum cofactor synthesis domain-containing protein